MARAGWFAGMFSASKLWKSSSISGPVSMLNPAWRNNCSILSLTLVTGCSPPRAAPRQRDVDLLLGEFPGDLGLFELELFLLDERLDLFAHAIDTRADFLFLLGRELAQLLELLGEPAALAQRADTNFFERRRIGRA